MAASAGLMLPSISTTGALEFSPHPADGDDVSAALRKGRIEAQEVLRFEHAAEKGGAIGTRLRAVALMRCVSDMRGYTSPHS